MAKLHIQEYSRLGEDTQGNITPVGREPAVNTQVVSYTTSAQSNAFGDSTKFVRVIADADVFLVFGSNPTATANSMYLPADTAEYFALSAKDLKVAAYDGTSS